MYNKVFHAIKSYIKKILLLPFDCLFKRDENKVIFVVRQNTYYSGNLRVVCEHLAQNSSKNTYIYKTDTCKPEIKASLETQGITVLDWFTPKAIYHLLTAKYFILSHSPLNAHISKPCNKRVVINLWHGVAIKGIELLMPNIPPLRKKKMEENSKIIDYMIASSKADQDVISRSFGLPLNKVHITGLPRYDLFSPDYKLDNYLQEQEKKLAQIKGTKKLILYAPTFRDHSTSPLMQITEKEWVKVEAFLVNNNAILGIRTHPYDKSSPDFFKSNKSFFLLSNDDFTEPNLVLKATDILIVDFSSIWVDFLMLNRPIVGYAKDFQHYLHAERGFVYDFNKVFPSEFSSNIQDLLQRLEVIFETKEFFVEYPYQKELLVNFPGSDALANYQALVWKLGCPIKN